MRGRGRMTAPGWRWLGALVVVGIAVFVATRPAPRNEFVADGPPVPAPQAGALTDLTADEFEGVLVGLRGRPVIVNIWASWCAPCRTETPLLERAALAHASDVVIIGVNSRDERSGALGFMDEFDVTFPNVFDRTGEIRRRLGLRGFPSTYVFGADGALRTTVVGGLTEQRLAAIIADVTA